MTLRIAAFAGLLALAAAPSGALDLSDMSESEREAFGEAVRAYLVANPEVIFEALVAAEQQRMADAAAADLDLLEARAGALFRTEGDPVMGNPEGDVTLTVFTDYRCPFCRETEADLRALVADDPGLRIVVKDYPVLAPDSRTASEFALAVFDLGGSEAHARAHEALFGLRGGYTEASLGRLATELGLEPEAVFDRMKGPEVAARIDANLALGQEFGLDATPSFALPRMVVRGQMPAGVLARYVAETRERAD